MAICSKITAKAWKGEGLAQCSLARAEDWCRVGRTRVLQGQKSFSCENLRLAGGSLQKIM